jgi:hypothetical protein
MRRIHAWLIAALFSVSVAFAQAGGVITFTAQTTTGDGTVTPVLTWSTAPAASSCTASGDWSGAKGAAGTETLAPIMSSATYNLTCTWADTTATLTWTAPTKNTDGSNYTDPAGYRIEYGQSEALGQSRAVPDPAATSYVFTDLAAGTWYFGMRTVNQRGAESERTNLVSKTLGTVDTTRAVAIVVNPVPEAASDFEVR